MVKFGASLICGFAAFLLLNGPRAAAQGQPSATPAAAASPAAPVTVVTAPVSAPVQPAASPAVSPAPSAVAPAPAVSPVPTLSGSAAPAVSGSGTVAVSGSAAATPASPYRIEIDLGKQRAYLVKDGTTIAEAPISSGRAGHLTPVGNFSVLEKDPNHFSSLYGKIVDSKTGRTVVSGADAAMAVPKGCRFDRAPMKFFLRFDGATGMHAGILPGYPASHGCVRMPASKAQLFYKTVDVGTPVHVFGDPPLRSHEEEPSHASRTASSMKKAAPSPTPAAKHGWWIF